MALTESDFASIQTMVNGAIAEQGQTFLTSQVVKRDEIRKLIWVKELGDQPIPLVGLKATVRVYDTDLPIGAMVPFGSLTPPSEFLLCDGTSYPTATYPELFAVLGYSYGGGGANFLVPNLKGRVLVGRDAAQGEFDVLGDAGGSKTHTLSATEMPSHRHGGTFWPNANPGAVGGNTLSLSGDSGGGTGSGLANAVDLTGGGVAHNNLQPYQVANYIIKAQGSRTKAQNVIGEALLPAVGDTVLVAFERGTRRLPRCLGVIQSQDYIQAAED